MIATAVGFVSCSRRNFVVVRRSHLVRAGMICAAMLFACRFAGSQVPESGPGATTPTTSSTTSTATTDAKGEPSPSRASTGAGPIAIVPVDSTNATVTGALSVAQGKALIATSGTVTSAAKATEVVLPRRGILRVCASTSVHLSTDASVPGGETPGLMMALDHGAIETSFATGQNSDMVLTPDFRILIGAPGAAELKVRLGQHGDTCVDNPGPNAPYVVVSSVFEGGAYRIQPGQRVMFQHGSLKEVVDQEKEPCGCPPEARPGTNDFPLAQSAGLAPLEKSEAANATATATATATAPQKPRQQLDQPLVYTAPPAPQPPPQPSAAAAPPLPAAQSAPGPASSAPKQKPGVFRSIGRFFKRIFGAE